MFDFLHYGFMQRALLSSVIVGTTCSFIGVFVVLRGMAFAGSGLAHAAFGGVALGFLLGALRAWGSYGLLALGSLPFLPILVAAGVALVVSIFISAMAAVYPAWVAARLAPMEAMRIE